jgi:hypothetical protein
MLTESRVTRVILVTFMVGEREQWATVASRSRYHALQWPEVAAACVA